MFRLNGVWTNSYEAEQHLSFNPPATEPVCWSLMGHASGWCTGIFRFACHRHRASVCR